MGPLRVLLRRHGGKKRTCFYSENSVRRVGRVGACGSGRLGKMSTSPALRDAHLAPDAAQDLAAGSRWEVSASPPREDIAAGLRRSTRSNFGMGPPSSPASAPGESRGRNRQRARRRAVSCEAPSRRNRLPRRPGALAVASQETASASPSGSQASASPSDSQASASPRSAGASRAKIPDKETLLLYASLTQAEAAGKLGCSISTVQIACRKYDFQWPRGPWTTKLLTEEQARSIFSERERGVKVPVQNRIHFWCQPSRTRIAPNRWNVRQGLSEGEHTAKHTESVALRQRQPGVGVCGAGGARL